MRVNRYIQTTRGIHYYLLIKELPPSSILADHQGQRIGELHSLGKQVVGIGSVHQSGIRYSLKGKNNSPWFIKLETLKDLDNFLAERNIFIKHVRKTDIRMEIDADLKSKGWRLVGKSKNVFAKRTGQNLEEALEQAKNYARKRNSLIAYA
ncbi:12286_t:CDS:2, partial [Funneliformis geosporum]